MKIVVPTNSHQGLNSQVAEHFGRCATYTFVNEKGEIVDIIKNSSEHMGGAGLPPELMKKHGANVLLCKGLGPRAIDLCQKLSIDVYVCQPDQADKVKDIFKLWQDEKIPKAGAADACAEHNIEH